MEYWRSLYTPLNGESQPYNVCKQDIVNHAHHWPSASKSVTTGQTTTYHRQVKIGLEHAPSNRQRNKRYQRLDLMVSEKY